MADLLRIIYEALRNLVRGAKERFTPSFARHTRRVRRRR